MNVFDEYIEKYVTSLDCGPDFPFNSSYEEFRMKRYENDGHDQFKDHVDVQDHPTARRMLSMFIYLNDVSEGGETYFPKLDLKITPRCGKLLIFHLFGCLDTQDFLLCQTRVTIIGSYLHYL